MLHRPAVVPGGSFERPGATGHRHIPGSVGLFPDSSHDGCEAVPGGRSLTSAGCPASTRESPVKTLIALLAWCLLLVLCWPLALLALVLWPLVWLVCLPFRLIGVTFSSLFALLQALLTLPARLLGWRPRPVPA